MRHPGEVLAQQKAGYPTPPLRVHPAMPEQHQLFYQGLQTFYLSIPQPDGYPSAALIRGEPGFITTPDAQHLHIPLSALDGMSYLPPLRPGMMLGGLGLDLSNRRRNRVNGVLEAVSDATLRIRVQEAFGNCPHYIQQRHLLSVDDSRTLAVETLAMLDADARYLITAADTLFVASHAPGQGADISHRGGMPGFITVQQGKLCIPDYSGNRLMNTIGNLLLEPRCALLIMDFHQGAALHIQGRAEILWQQKGGKLTERYWTLEPQHIVRLRQLLPAAGLDVSYADSSRAAAER